VLTRLSGTVMLSMALFLLGRCSSGALLYQEKRFHPQLGVSGRGAGDRRRGVRFGGLRASARSGLDSRHRPQNQHRVWAGGTLLAVYSLGLGLPFLLSGLLLGRLGGALGWVKRHFRAHRRGSAMIIGAFGCC